MDHLDAEESCTRYVFGSTRSSEFPTLVVLTPTNDGWKARSTSRAYSHDYVCYESFGDVMKWIDIDLHRPFLARDRDEVVSILTNTDSAHTTGFLYPGGCSSKDEEVERVLQHLECGP